MLFARMGLSKRLRLGTRVPLACSCSLLQALDTHQKAIVCFVQSDLFATCTQLSHRLSGGFWLA